MSATIWQTFNKASASGVHCVSPNSQIIQLQRYVQVLLAHCTARQLHITRRYVQVLLAHCTARQLHITSQTHQIQGCRLLPRSRWNCALLGYYASSSGNFSPTFRGTLSLSSSWVKNYQYSPHNNPEGRSYFIKYEAKRY